MRRSSTIALAVCCVAGSAAAEPGWGPLTYSDPRHPGPLDAAVLPLWRRELTGKPFYQMQAARIEAGGETYLASMALAEGLCTSGANDKHAVAEPAVCDARVDVLRDGAVVRTVRGRACSVASLPEDGTADHTDATLVRFDPAGGSVRFRSRMRGRFVKGCDRAVRLR